ncbi:MAG: BspA family leucine-rich repeat surface protein [Clostridium sp.]|nr:BspA family leucine-rich repeat surface protein [Clostridium sp.]
MNRIVNFLQKYFAVISVLIGISILLSVTFSSYIVTSNNHKAAEMYIGELKYSMEINGSTTNTLSVPTGETIVDVKVNNLNPVDTYYKLLYLKNTNIIVKYYVSASDLDDSNNVVKTYDKPNDSVMSNGSKIVKLQITNNSTSSQSLGLSVIGGYITNTLNDIVVPSTYNEITPLENSTNTYFCKTNDTLTQGLKYVNGQYTYAYMQEGNGNTISSAHKIYWDDISDDGWGVQLTDKANDYAVTSKPCTYVNNIPIISMSAMFFYSTTTSIDLSSFNTSNVTNMEKMFKYVEAPTLNLSSFNTSKVKNMNAMFFDSKITKLDLSSFNTSNVINMNAMFRASETTTIDVSSFDTSNVIDMGDMFRGSMATTLNLSNFDTSKVTDMSAMFFDNQATILNLSSFNTSNVINIVSMFAGVMADTLDLSNFDTSKITSMDSMFNSCNSTTIDLSSFDTSKVTDMYAMFTSSPNLKTIYASNKFVTTSVDDSRYMFKNCTNLVGGSGTKFNSSYIDKTYARIDGGTSNPGYFTEKPSTFSTDSWATIVSSVKAGNTRGYKVGETKTIDLGTTYGTHTLRIANTTTPSECSTTGFSQSACGFVIEFADIITKYNMNTTANSRNGWPASSMYTFVNNDIYNALPAKLKSVIIDTIVVSGHGNYNLSNFTSTDKLYLLSPREVWNYSGTYDAASSSTRQLDYYKEKGVSTSNYSGAIKKNGTSASAWWLRTATSSFNGCYYSVMYTGAPNDNNTAELKSGVSPAFRIG